VYLTPSEFAIARGAKLYDWQIEALESFGKGWPTALLTCNGAGKTAIIAAWACAWFFYRFPRGKLVATSGSFNQLQNQLWPSLKQHMPEGTRVTNGGSPCTITTPEGGKGIGFSTNDPGKAEGSHPLVSREVDPVFILVDEAKTVPEGIFIAFDRCTYSFVLYISSAGMPMGRFFECFHKLAKYFYTIRIPSSMCPHIPDAKRERDREVMDAASFNSTHEAEFFEDGSFLLMTPIALRAALNIQPEPVESGEIVAFFDFARGRDENVFALRKGNHARIVKAWKGPDTVQAVRQFIQLAKIEGLSSGQCWGDADGMGGSMCDIFKDEGFRINEFRGGRPALDPGRFVNLISEVWIDGGRQIETGRVHLGVLDPITFDQLTTRLIEWKKTGQRHIESKDDLKLRGIKSPDRADALLGCIMCGSHMTGALTSDTIKTAAMPSNAFAVRHEVF
jgi:hypothetical protein